VEDCKFNLHGRWILNKGDKPITPRNLYSKLTTLWKHIGRMKLIPLGRSFFKFQEVTGLQHLQSKTVTCSYLDMFDRSPTQHKYWCPKTLFETGSRVSTPLLLDDATKIRTFDHYVRDFVDLDLSKRIYDDIIYPSRGECGF